MGYDFKGIYNIWEKNLELFNSDDKQKISKKIKYGSIDDQKLKLSIGSKQLNN